MKKRNSAGIALIFAIVFDLAFSCFRSSFAEGVADRVDTRYGIGATCGSCLVGPSVPYGSIHPGPDGASRRSPASGYRPGDAVDGFSQIHAHGAGSSCPSYGLFLVRPGFEGEAYRPSRIVFEETRPYRFRGRLESGVGVTLAATAHGAIYRFSYPAGRRGKLEWDVHRKIARAVASKNATLTRKGNCLWGGGTYSGNWNPAPYDCFFYAEETREGNDIVLRIAVSFKSVETARGWFGAEVKGRSVDDVAADAKRLWNERLGVISVRGLDAEGERRFYANLYHCFIQPRDRSGDFAWSVSGESVFDDQYTVWDTWRTLFPLWTIVDPARAAANVNSYASRQRRLGRCEIAFIGGKDFQAGQAGDDVDNVIADAFAKDVPGLDREGAWAVLAAHAARRTQSYRERGWAVTSHPEGYDKRFRSGSATLGFAYNDWCAAQVAAKLGKRDAAALLARSGNWTNVWDATAVDERSGFTGFVRARHSDGRFSTTPPRKGKDFYQGSAWEYSFFVPHDVAGLIERCGGKETFAKRLAYAFDSNLIDFSNEPSFLTPFLACFCNRPDLAARCAAKLKASFTEKGPPGDDDSGAMASLYVFLSAGFFPIAGQDLYALQGTDVPEIRFNLPGGRTFTVRGASGTGCPQAYLNGRKLTEPFIRHRDIVAGGELRFERR